MTNLLLLNPDGRLFVVDAVENIVRSERGFEDVRFDEPGGALIEAKFVDGDDWTLVRLAGNRKRISLSGTSSAAITAALIFQKRLDQPMRIVDTDYSFDLMLGDFATAEELQAAIDKARAQ